MARHPSFKVVGENVKRLRLSPHTPKESQSINKFAKWAGVANGTLDRIERGVTDPQLSHLLRIADKYKAYGMHVWHLFVPGIDLMALPAYISKHEQEMHENIRQSYQALGAGRPATVAQNNAFTANALPASPDKEPSKRPKR